VIILENGENNLKLFTVFVDRVELDDDDIIKVNGFEIIPYPGVILSEEEVTKIYYCIAKGIYDETSFKLTMDELISICTTTNNDTNTSVASTESPQPIAFPRRE
jgi:hypothetical protein